MLRLAEHMEMIEDAGAMFDELLDKLNLPNDELYRLQLEAFEWSHNVSRHAH
jgi:anti-sigma regulatory factor (Ser/Thr protein kinase)